MPLITEILALGKAIKEVAFFFHKKWRTKAHHLIDRQALLKLKISLDSLKAAVRQQQTPENQGRTLLLIDDIVNKIEGVDWALLSLYYPIARQNMTDAALAEARYINLRRITMYELPAFARDERFLTTSKELTLRLEAAQVLLHQESAADTVVSQSVVYLSLLESVDAWSSSIENVIRDNWKLSDWTKET
jgi:hypothetical protein